MLSACVYSKIFLKALHNEAQLNYASMSANSSNKRGSSELGCTLLDEYVFLLVLYAAVGGGFKE